MESIKLIIKQIILDIKYFINNRMNLLLSGMFVLAPMILVIFIMPIERTLSFVLFIGSVAPAMLIYISINYTIRSGTLNKNIRTTKNNKYIFNISNLIFFYIVLLLYFYIDLLSINLISMMGLLKKDWIGAGTYKIHFWWTLDLRLLYSIIELGFISFAILFLSQYLIKTKKGMYTLVLSLILLQVVYGGCFNSYFYKAYWTGGTPYNGDRVPMFQSSAFPNSLYWPTLLFYPLFGASQHVASLKIIFGRDETAHSMVKWFVWLKDGMSDNGLNYPMRWNILWFSSWIYSFTLIFLGLLIGKYKNT